jgi:predicted HAD superfamily Cof-like phosphohydrolase
MSKGDKDTRVSNRKVYMDNWDKIYGKKDKQMIRATNFEKAGDFMEAFGQEVRYIPIVPGIAEMALRLDLINEEVQELREGMGKRSLLEIADALTDILYVVYGAGHTFGIDLDDCFEEVHRSNMTKLGEDGTPIYNQDGKVMKGPYYEEPDLTPYII